MIIISGVQFAANRQQVPAIRKRRMKTYLEWVQEAQSADSRVRNDAFDHLVRDFQGMVYGVAYSRLSNTQLAEDAAQDAFLRRFQAHRAAAGRQRLPRLVKAHRI